MRKRFLVILLLVIVGTMKVLAVTEDDVEQATLLTKNFRLDVQNCPTLEEVADKQLTNVKWDNPGGSDDFYCYAKMMGVQQNQEVFSVIFRYDIENKQVELFSLRIGKKLYVKVDAMQKQIVKLFAAESEEVRHVMMVINNY